MHTSRLEAFYSRFKFLFRIFLLKCLLVILVKDVIKNYRYFHAINSDLSRLYLEARTKPNGSYDLAIEEIKHKIKLIFCPMFGEYFLVPVNNFILKYLIVQIDSSNLGDIYGLLANITTLITIFISIPTIWLLSKSKSINQRRIGCIIFQLTRLIDYMDGPLSRKSLTPNKNGRLYDAVGNGVSTSFFLIGTFIFILDSEYVLQSSHDIINGVNSIYVYLNRICRFIINKILCITTNEEDLDQKFLGKLDIKFNHLKLVYNMIAIFLFYLILSGIGFNLALDRYNLYVENFMVIFIINFLILNNFN